MERYVTCISGNCTFATVDTINKYLKIKQVDVRYKGKSI